MDKKEVQKELTALLKLYTKLYGRGLIGVGNDQVHVDNQWFDELAVPNTVTCDEDNHYSALMPNGTRIMTIKEGEPDA